VIHAASSRSEDGMSLVELLIALTVLSIGIIGLARVFPAGARAQAQDQLLMKSNFYAQEQLETLTGRNWSDPLLTDGRHPPGTACDTLAGGNILRFYSVTTMTGKLDNLKKLNVMVTYHGAGQQARTVTATTFVRR
jgi:prepilin-type N-terminal cleavage/methylation domain-containing protein